MRKVLLFNMVLFLSLFAWAEKMPTGYYLPIEGLKDDSLKGTLKKVIRSHTAIEYGDGTWTVFYYSDRDSATGLCMDMYCDTWKTFSSPGSTPSGCNIEHSFAKSWWGGTKNDAYKDCYHLNPSNGTVNSSRGNYPLGVPTKEFKSNTGSLKVGKRHHAALKEDHYVFEPKDEYKGDFARAYFYMATCYGTALDGSKPDLGKCSKKDYVGWRVDNKDVGAYYAMRNDSYLEFQDWEIEVLLTWHRQDPVSEKELKRMEAVSNYQHNRNPFIDYPCLAEYIWGNRKGQRVRLANLTRTYEVDWTSRTDSTDLTGCSCQSTNLDYRVDTEWIPSGYRVEKCLIHGTIYIRCEEKLYDLLGHEYIEQ